jgi:hypothetical protein
MLVRLLALVVLAVCAAPATAHAYESPVAYTAVAGNPADALAELPIEDSVYDRATKCSARPKAGMTALVEWLTRNAAGAFWGTYRCEKLGPGSASLHAEGRAVDWALDVAVPAQRRAAEKLIALLLAPDRLGRTQALARRMGVEELIWDCGYWGAGMPQFRPYGPCLSKRGKVRRSVNKTIAHRDHLHIGMTKAGAAKKTSFWTRG